MGAFRRTLSACAVAVIVSANGCTTPDSFEGSAERPRPLPPAVARGSGVPRAAVGAPVPAPPSKTTAPAQPVPLPVVPQVRAELPPPLVPVVTPASATVPAPPLPEPARPLPVTEWLPVGATEPLRPPIVVPDPRAE